ncbi:MAG TPA: lysylphosphatidylglycerol synthase transmembrane domain-containing protein [Kiritimatiellia bacterium]|nr:lysylphosphatidylglycerol synthase transmembrane domain-containing protein [Kiritimatiellia bacterium]HNS82068.1 lysylphosphatidylglycerol synthase transmembrane domain-containing protein [Kiritimatiellia bacterium]HPA78869.1 lysylphosphatidylglycerol synthase transmembrane domain-containing protein [Kiritimatiellia bacterium]HQQ05214.1 lysylphosphatidylglycerol synthase transmembrane domain-containing protein [Kiritimatiellia bacterium]
MKGIRKFIPLVKIAFSVCLLTFLYARADWTSFREIFSQASPVYLLPIFILCFLNTLASAFKWELLLKADGIDVGLWRLARSYLIGTFFNLFLPSSIGGDAYRIYDVSKRSSRAAEGFASVFADRFTGFLAIAAWGLVFSLAGIRRLPEPRIILIPAGVFALMMIMVWMLLQQRLLLWGLRLFHLDRLAKLQEFVRRFLNSISTYRRNGVLLVKTLSISLAFQFMVIVIVWMMGLTLGLDIGMLPFAIFIPLITLIEALPISIYGLGVRDGAYVFFFSQVGVSREAALSLALLYVAITFVYAAVFGGAAFLTRGKREVPA